MLVRIRTLLASLLGCGLLAVSLVALPATASAAPDGTDASCWSFRFTGNFFPNPVNRVTHGTLKAEAQFLALGDDFQMYPGDIYVHFYTTGGQLVLSGFVGTIQPMPTQQFPVADVRGLARAIYVVHLEVRTSICGNRSFSERVSVA